MTDNIKTLVERLRHQFKTKNVFAACDLIEQQARRIAELEAARIAYASEFPADAEGLPDVGNVHANIRLLKKRIADLEAITTIPDYAMPPGDQEWERVDPAVAFHLIERHAENWAHAGQLMDAWRMANSPAPVADSAMAKDAERWRWIEKRLRLGPPIGPRGIPKRRCILADMTIGSGDESCETVADVIDAAIAASEPKKTGE